MEWEREDLWLSFRRKESQKPMTLEDLLEQIQIEVLTESSLADQKLVKEMSVEVTLITHGLTVKQRRMLFQILHRFYELVERLAE
jgi:hypothetical protein